MYNRHSRRKALDRRVPSFYNSLKYKNSSIYPRHVNPEIKPKKKPKRPKMIQTTIPR
jgi:hypothetical protein